MIEKKYIEAAIGEYTEFFKQIKTLPNYYTIFDLAWKNQMDDGFCYYLSSRGLVPVDRTQINRYKIKGSHYWANPITFCKTKSACIRATRTRLKNLKDILKNDYQ